MVLLECFMFFLLVSLVGCMPNVLPSSDGIHSVVLFTDNKQDGTFEAKKQAKRYCKRKEKKQYYVEDQTISYVCAVDEVKYIRAKKAAAAVGMTGIATSTGLASAGLIADAAIGDCYEVKMHFVCK